MARCRRHGLVEGSASTTTRSCFPKQVIEKCDYYAHADWARRAGALDWANEAYLTLGRPFRVHNVHGLSELARALPRTRTPTRSCG